MVFWTRSSASSLTDQLAGSLPQVIVMVRDGAGELGTQLDLQTGVAILRH